MTSFANQPREEVKMRGGARRGLLQLALAALLACALLPAGAMVALADDPAEEPVAAEPAAAEPEADEAAPQDEAPTEAPTAPAPPAQTVTSPKLLSRLSAPATAPTDLTVAEIAFRDKNGDFIAQDDDASKNVNFLDLTATSSNPAFQRAASIEVAITAPTAPIAGSKVVLVDENGEAIAEATFSQAVEEDGTTPIAYTWVAKLEHPTADPAKPLPEQAVGLKVIASDGTHTLEVTDDADKLSATDKDYALFGAKVKEFDVGGTPTKKIYADGALVLDRTAPVFGSITVKTEGSTWVVANDKTGPCGTASLACSPAEARMDATKSTVTLTDLIDSSHPVTTVDLTWDSLTKNLTFDMPDGLWNIDYRLVDAAGNVGDQGTFTNVSADSSGPLISFSYKGEEIADTAHPLTYDATGTLTVIVKDQNFDTSATGVGKTDIRYYSSALSSAEFSFAYDKGAWQKTGVDTYAYEINLGYEGFYRFVVDGIDTLENTGQNALTLTIDFQEPEVSAVFLDEADQPLSPCASIDSPLSAACFDKKAKVRVTITDNRLDLTESKVALRGSVATGELAVGTFFGGVDYPFVGTVLKTVSDTMTDGKRTIVFDVTYPQDGVVDMPVVTAKDYVHEAVTGRPSDKPYLLIDTTAPELAASISEDPAADGDLGKTAAGAQITNGEANGSNRVWFFKTGEQAVISLAVTEAYGIKSLTVTDPSGRYGTTSAESVRTTGNATLTGAGKTTTFNDLTLADPLQQGKDFSDGVTVTAEDLVGHTTTWSLANGLATPGAGTVVATLLVEDDTDPVLTLDPTDGITSKDVADAAGQNPTYVRYFNEDKTFKLSLSDLTLKYLRGFKGGAEGDEYDDVDGYYSGLDPSRVLVDIKRDGADADPLAMADLTSSGNGADYALTHTFHDDGAYEVSLVAKDVVGNEATGSIEKFVIDQTAPTIKVTYDDTDAHHGSYYAKKPRTATITVVEHNFDPDLFTVDVTHFKNHADGATEPSYTWDGSTSDTHTCTVTFPVDGEYALAVSGQDKAGNAAVLASDATVEGYDSGIFTIDTEKPVIAGYYDNGTAPAASFDADDPALEFPEPSGTLGGTNYYAHPISLLAQVKDRNLDAADLAGVLALKVTHNGTEAARDVTWGRVPDERGTNGYELWQTTVAFDEDGEYLTPHVTATDLADNTADNETDKTAHDLVPFVIDLKPPTVKVSVDKKPASQGKDGKDPYNFYNQATKMTFTVSDEHKLRSVEVADPDGVYTVSKEAAAAEGKGSVTFTVSLKDGTVPKDNEYQRDIVLTAEDLAGNERIWTIDHTGKVVKDEQVDGAWKQVASSDANAGINGGTEHPMSLIQDTVAPVVGLTGVTAGTYYNKPQTVTATIQEFNLGWLQRFDPQRTVVTITQYAGAAGRAKTVTTVPVSSFAGTKPNFSYAQVFSTDGHYVIEAQFADFATNLSNKATIGEFTIDMTPPQIQMEFDNKEARNGKYYKATRTATITVTEHNFDPKLITIEAEGGTIGGWSTDGDKHVCTIFFGEGGPYTVKVGGKDLAGNEASEVTEPEFIVDLTAPEVKISGTAQRLGFVGDATWAGAPANAYHGDLEDQSAYNGVVVPVITYTDNEDLVADDLSFMLAGSKHGEDIEVESVTSEPGKEMTTTLADIGYQAEGPADGSNWQAFYVDDYAIDADDIYTLTAKLTDQAGNEAEGELTFSVNRFGSNYDVRMQGLEEDELAEYQKSGMLSAAPTIVVREINVSGVEKESDHHVEKEFANATTAIRRADNEATGYRLQTISPKRSTNGWSEYVYTVRNTNFGEGSDSDHDDRGQGVYRVNVTSDDTASNANTTADFWKSGKRRTKATAAGATAEFVLDELGPAIDDLDLPEHLSRGASYLASFHVTDDITSGNTVEVTVDGTKLAAGEVQGPTNGAGTFTFEIPAKPFNWNRSVKIVVRDYAGREVSEQNHTWIWQSSFVPEAGLVLGMVAAVAVGIAAWLRKRAAAEPELPEW